MSHVVPIAELSRATRTELSEVLALVKACELLETGVAEAIESFVVARAAGSLRGFQKVERAAVPAEIAESWEFRVGCPQTALPMRLILRSS
jgi:N-acetylglutamate synthase-like GNAT family acetyltransferase